MTISVLVIVTGSILFVLGYRLDGNNGRLEQGALVQFDSVPNGAYITVDGKVIGARTPAKQTIIAGTHSFIVSRDNYHNWAKSLTVQSGTLTWLDYIRLVPKVLKPESIKTYPTVYGEKASPNYEFMLVQEKAEIPSFHLLDLRTQNVQTSNLVLPVNTYSEATTAGVTHNFTIDSWDEGGRYVLLKHTFGDKWEWIVADTANMANSINVTTLLGVTLVDLQFAGTNGKALYGLLNDGVLRKLDLNSATISRGLVTHVKSFELFETNMISYVGIDPLDSSKQVAGVYRDGDESSHVLRTTTLDVPLLIDSTRYFSDDFVAIAEGLKVTVLKGHYPTSSADEATSLKQVAQFATSANVDSLSFSPSGDYVVARAGLTFVSYEVEHERTTNATIETAEMKAHDFAWLDDAYLWATYDGHLSIREFDGTNTHVIMAMEPGFDATLSKNGRYLYGISKTNNVYHLQRVKMILD